MHIFVSHMHYKGVVMIMQVGTDARRVPAKLIR
jgi:hypothetical protein